MDGRTGGVVGTLLKLAATILVAGALVAGLLTATLFSLAHLPPDLPTFLDRFLFGLAASAVVWLTGGLEAAIVLHAVNNVIVFVLVGALGQEVALDEQTPAAAAWLNVTLTALAMGLYVWLVARSRRRLHPETVTPALDLRTVPPIPPAAPWPVSAAVPYPPGPFPAGRPASPP